MREVIFTVLMVLFGGLLFAQKTVVKAELLPNQKKASFDQQFYSYQLYQISLENLLSTARNNSNDFQVNFELGTQHNWNLHLYSHDILGADHMVTIEDENGQHTSKIKQNIAYRGYEMGNVKDEVRLTMDEDFLYGYVTKKGIKYFIEPAYYFDKSAAKNQFIIYSENEVRPNPNATCGLTELENQQHKLDHHQDDREDVGNSRMSCLDLELAIASDFSMVQKYGSALAVINHNIGVMNNVQINYDDEFGNEIRFIIVTQFISACASCDPWTSELGAGNLLGSFRAWGQALGFGVFTYDMAQMWTNRNFTGSTIGIAYLNGLCNSVRYHAIQDFSSNAGLIRVVAAHEIGHNLGAFHDGGGAGTIMAPAVNNTNTWSLNSINDINNTINGGIANGCLTTCAEEPDGPATEPLEVLVVNASDETCKGYKDGSIDLVVSGGVGGYVYFWNVASDNTASLNNLAPGNYQCTVIDDSNNFVATPVIQIKGSPSDLILNVEGINNAACDGSLVGGIDLSVTGGNPGYLFFWNNFFDTEDIINMPAGNYSVTVIDGNGCIQSIPSIQIPESAPPTADAGQDDFIDCNNSTLVLDGTNSTFGPGLEYHWTTENGNILNGVNSQSPEIDAPGIYTLTVNNTITNCSASDDVEIFDGTTLPTADAGEIKILNCNNSAVQLDGTNSSEGSDFSYSWEIDVQGNILVGQNSMTPTVDAQGIYILTVSNDATGCISKDTIKVEEDFAAPILEILASNDIDCNDDIAIINSKVTPNNGNYSYEWFTSSSGNIVSGQSTSSIEVDAGAGYQLIVTNQDNGCTDTESISISANNLAPMPQIEPAGILNCINEAIEIQSTSSGIDISYSWTTTDGNIIANDNSSNAFVDAPGTYNLVVVNNDNGCIGESSVEVSEDVEIPDADAGPDAFINCMNETVVLDGSGSSTGDEFAYLWRTNNGNILTGEEENTAQVDEAGAYRLIVTNTENGCTSFNRVDVFEDKEEPNTIIEISNQIDCENDAASITAAVSNATNYEFEWLAPDGTTIEEGDNFTTNLATTYSLFVTNTDNGCTSLNEFEVVENTELPNADAGLSAEITCVESTVLLGSDNTSAGSNITYEWTGTGIIEGENESIAEVDQSGEFILTVTNTDNNCTASASVEVTENTIPPIADAGVASSLDCNNNSIVLDGSASSSGAFTYNWTTANGNIIADENTISPTVSQAGIYTLEVTSRQNGCTATSSVEVTQTTDLPTADAGATVSLNCDSSPISLDGSASSSGSNFSYTWTSEDGNILQDATTLTPLINAPGTYELTVENTMNGCVAVATVEVNQNSVNPEVVIADAGEINCMISTLTLDATSSTGQGDLTYQWTTANGNIIQKDGENGCTSIESITVEADFALPTAVAESMGQINCVNSEISLDGSASSGQGDLIYQWTTADGSIIAGANSVTPTIDEPGTYAIIVTDTDNSCVSSTSIEITANVTPPNANAVATGALTCVETDLLIDGSTSTGQGTLSYFWTTPDGNIAAGIDTESVLIDEVGTYTLEVTDNANGCIDSDVIEIIQDLSTPTAVANTGFINCYNPEVTLDGNPSFGNGDISYQWSSNSGNIIAGENTANPIINSGGTYELIVTQSSNGCTDMISVEVEEDTTPPIADAGEIMELYCSNSNTSLVGEGSSQGDNFSYEWSTDEGSILAGVNNLNIVVGAPGSYTLEVTNLSNGCIASSTTEAILGEEFSAEIVDFNPVSCNGLNDGSVNLFATSGTAPYDYFWSNGQNTDQITGLAAGFYTVSVFDSNNCWEELIITITEPNPLNNSIISQDEMTNNGNDGFANITTTGGTAPYTYQWSNGASTSNVSDLAPGAYTITVSDANGCMSIETLAINSFNCIIDAAVVPQDVTCFGDNNGSAELALINAELPVTIIWRDINSGNELSNTSQNISNLSGGAYSVEVIDANNCSTILAFGINEPAPIDLGINVTPISMIGQDNGKLTSTISGGTAPFQYNWSNGGTTFEITNLSAGTYGLTVTDSNGCTMIAQAMISQLDCTLAASIEGTNLLCADVNDGVTTVTVTAGNGPYLYNWSNGFTGPVISNLPPGNYFVTITDDIGCQQILNTIITAPASLSLEIDVENPTTNISMDGMATVNVDGGTSPYTYLWSNGATTPIITGVVAGEYSVVVTDNNGCTISEGILLEQPNPLSIGILQNNVTCNGGNDGNATVSVNGGNPPYNYLWSNGQTTSSVSGLMAGSYTVTITDVEAFMLIEEITITEPDAIFSVVETFNVTCFGGNDGLASIQTTNGGTSPYSIQWNDPNLSFGPVASNLPAGNFQFTITDGSECESIQTVIINEPDELVLSVITVNNESGQGDNGLIDVEVVGGVEPYIFDWSNGSNLEDQENIPAGEYTLTVIDANGCEVASETIVVTSTVSIDFLSTDENISLYPNPTNGEFVLDFDLTTNDNIEIEILDVIGRKIYTTHQEKVQKDKINFDLENQADGIYMVKIKLRDSLMIQKVVKQSK